VRNDDQKIKDMCESVLPSTSRKNAREKRRIAHGANRARERAALRAARNDGDYERELGDSDGRRRNAIREMVWDRRAADKVAPLVRWARVTVEEDPVLRNAAPEDVTAYFAALLPDNLIGRHAIQHIRWGLGLDRDREVWLARSRRRWAERDAAARQRDLYREAVVALVEAGRHGDVNHAVRKVRRAQIARAELDGKPVEEVQLVPFLAGAHAIEEFLAATQNDVRVRATILSRF
jgi:hypothetical protein